MNRMMKHRCPKCGGNVFLYNDFDGWYEQCLQCSHTKFLDVMYESKEKVGSKTASEIEPVAVM